MTTVSVVTPSYGYARFIRDALESVRRQEVTADVEHVVVDGGSTDGTSEILRAQPAAGLTWISEPDHGQSDALNKALALSKGEWVTWLNADEFYLPGALQALLDAAATGSADVIYGDAVFVDEEGRVLRLLPEHRFSRTVLRSFGCYIPTYGSMFRRAALAAVGGWDERLRRIMDWDLYLRLERAGRAFRHVRYPIGAFRLHSSQVTAAPPGAHTDDFSIVWDRHDLPTGAAARQTGRALHGALKAADGAYVRQLRTMRRLRGSDLRWFAGDAGRRTSQILLREIYGRG